jgi:hypothetical protein
MTKEQLEKLLEEIRSNGFKAIEAVKQLSGTDEIDKTWGEFWLSKTERMLNNTNNRLVELAKNKMLIYDDTAEVRPFWKSIMSTVKKSINTTNLVSLSTFGSSLSDNLLMMQRDAIKRGVAITRIFVYQSPEDDDDEQLALLKSYMATQLAFEINVRAIKRNVFDNAIQADGYKTNEDFMIVDERFIYETHYDATDGVYRNFLCKDEQDIVRKKKVWETIKATSKQITFENVNNFNRII